MSFTSLQTIIGSLSNSFVIVTFLAARELRRRHSDLLILNLAVADLIFITTFQPWLTHFLNQNGVITLQDRYYFYESLGEFVILSSQQAIMLIAIDHLIVVVLLLRYKTLVTRKVIYISIIIFWTFALVIGIVNYLAYTFKFYFIFLVFILYSGAYRAGVWGVRPALRVPHLRRHIQFLPGW